MWCGVFKNMALDNLSFLERPKLKGEATIIGVPLDLGKDAEGTAEGPKTFREAGLIETMKGIGLDVHDLGDLDVPDKETADIGAVKLKYLDPIVKVCDELAHHVSGEVNLGRKVIVLGGDNSISIGSVSGASTALKGDLGLIWIDSHADIITDATTLSGNIHGMPVSALLGFGDSSLSNIYSDGQKIKPQNLVYVGLKDLDQAEIDTIRALRVSTTTIVDIAEKGLSPAFEAIKKLSERVKNVWVCLDIDSMDEECAPGTPMATKGGLSYRESINLARFIGKVCNVVGMDVTEFAPQLDRENKTVKLAIELISCYLGSETNWYTRYMDEEMRKQAEREAAE